MLARAGYGNHSLIVATLDTTIIPSNIAELIEDFAQPLPVS